MMMSAGFLTMLFLCRKDQHKFQMKFLTNSEKLKRWPTTVCLTGCTFKCLSGTAIATGERIAYHQANKMPKKTDQSIRHHNPFTISNHLSNQPLSHLYFVSLGQHTCKTIRNIPKNLTRSF